MAGLSLCISSCGGAGTSGAGGATSTSNGVGASGSSSTGMSASAGGATSSSTGGGCPVNTGSCSWTAAQQDIAWRLTSIWENDTTILQYSYCENIMDGRGYTSGRAGFCSGCGDAVKVVDCYAQANTGSTNRMSKYGAALVGLSGADTSPLDAIGDYCGDWTASATDAQTATAFDGCQDTLTMSLYQTPGCNDALAWGIRTPLFLAELYDAEINHGEPDVSDMLATAGQQANIVQSASPLSIADESKLLHAFLTVRVGILAADPTWAEAVDRVAVYEKERLAQSFDLSQPITTDAHASSYWPSLSLKSSGYSVCTLTPSGCSALVSGDPNCKP